MVPRHLGGDDGRDDAAVRSAGGRSRRTCVSGSADSDLRRRLPRRLDCIRHRRLRALPRRDVVRPRPARLGPKRALRRGCSDRSGRHLRVDAAEAATAAPLPQPTRSGRAWRPRGRRGERPVLRRLLPGPDGRAVRARRDERGLDGRDRRRDLRREDLRERTAADACCRHRPDRSWPLGRSLAFDGSDADRARVITVHGNGDAG